VAVIALALFLGGAAMVSAGGIKAATAQSDGRAESIECPTMTDSISRLFLAFFNREPNATEFRQWAEAYRSGAADLGSIAQQLADSGEFRDRYGNLDAAGFVELVYRNTLRTTALQTDVDFWVANLDAGYGRGPMMLAFSESEEFVRRTGTATPLAGFLRWYPEGTHWYCGVGPRQALPITPLDQPVVFADFLFTNEGDGQADVGLSTALDGTSYLSLTAGSLPAGFASYKWGGSFDGDGGYGNGLTINADEQTSWVVVFYPVTIGEERAGWQIAR
jgi:hypothetical protein